jgi:hypothetical protein
MSEVLKAVVVNGLTSEVTERPLTPDEIADLQATATTHLEREAEAQAKADARESALAKLADLGLTQDEINAL